VIAEAVEVTPRNRVRPGYRRPTRSTTGPPRFLIVPARGRWPTTRPIRLE